MGSYSLQTVERTLQLLDTFASQPTRVWGLTELSRKLGIHKTTMLRMLTTLEEQGYLVREGETSGYRLGPSALALGGAAMLTEVRQVGHAELRKLAENTGETAMLHVVKDMEAVCIDKVESPQPVRVTYDIGRRGPLYAGGSGKNLLAFMNTEEFEQRMPLMKFLQHTSRTITDVDKLRAEILLIRRRGYALSSGELDCGVSSIGAPVWNSMGVLEAGVTLVGPTERWNKEKQTSCVQEILSATQRISQKLGYRLEEDEQNAKVFE